MIKSRLILRRSSKYRNILRVTQWCITITLLAILFDFLRELWRPRPSLHHVATAQNLRSNNTRSVYIASVQWNSEAILQSSWIPTLLELVIELQAVNIKVYVSVYEGGSRDGTKKAMSQLADSLKQLNVNNSIKLDTESHEDVISKFDSKSGGWLQTPRGKELRRIVHLSNVRNRALEPLSNLNRAGVKFDKILYLNDIVYSTQDALTLLNTKNGVYAAACGLDYMNPPWNHVDAHTLHAHPPGMYDGFATRDSDGHILGSSLFPYFASPVSKHAILSGEIVPVQSCWNGMAAFNADPFQSIENPLRFRSIPDSLAEYHVEASECCLIHYDNPLSKTLGVWINPAVRVGYSPAAHTAVSQVIDFFAVTRSHSQSPSFSKLELYDRSQRVYIASIHWNNEAILRSNWTEAVVNLAKYLGPAQVYISIYESGSWDDSKGALRLLDSRLEELGVNKTILLNDSTHVDEIAQAPAPSGWIDTPRGQKELRRIPYLSKLRNISLRPLTNLAANNIKFDKILFLNDVVFSNEDVINLLYTREGEYAAACSLDFSKSPQYYDTFALRDHDGYETVTSTFPYFRSKVSRQAIISGEPVPVQSCWNGMVAFDATPFYNNSPLQFRGVPDSLARHHLEASECCLIHADNPQSATRGVWLNPRVRVGYNPEAYATVHPQTPWPPTREIILGVWKNRLRCWLTPTFHKTWKVGGRVRKWEREGKDRYEPGYHCLINEMQVLVSNGWAHV